MEKYNRSGAIQYAAKWCNSYNPAWPYYDGTDDNTDCANFVSQCMYEGGGIITARVIGLLVGQVLKVCVYLSKTIPSVILVWVIRSYQIAKLASLKLGILYFLLIMMDRVNR